jgi:hypothetical protein
MNHQQRRAAEHARRRADYHVVTTSKAILVQIIANLAAEDPTISGATTIIRTARSYSSMPRYCGVEGRHDLILEALAAS